MIGFCVLAVLTAVAGFASVAFALGPGAMGGAILLAATGFGAVSLGSGLAATVLALRRAG